jgi:Carboxypeptidase regulatory-like domain
MTRRSTTTTAAAILVLMVLAGCVPALTPGPTASPSAGPSASAAPSPSAIASPEAAAALVVASDSRFSGIGPKDPNVIGACCFWEASAAPGGYQVRIEIGWGDCPSGCIDRHDWTFSVSTAGAITLVSEQGPPVPAGVGGAGDGSGVIGIRGIATAGPVCPVVRPNDPNCADRPVAGATVHVLDASGTEVAVLETDLRGTFVVTLAPGRYRVAADPVGGLMHSPKAVDVTVGAGLVLVQLTYDTGIR